MNVMSNKEMEGTRSSIRLARRNKSRIEGVEFFISWNGNRAAEKTTGRFRPHNFKFSYALNLSRGTLRRRRRRLHVINFNADEVRDLLLRISEGYLSLRIRRFQHPGVRPSVDWWSIVVILR